MTTTVSGNTMRRSLGAAAALSLVACAAQSPRRPVPPTPPAPPPQAAYAQHSADAFAPALARPQHPACTWTAAAWAPAGAAPTLLASRGGTLYAIVTGKPDVEMVLPVGAGSDGAWVRIARGASFVQGWTPERIPLYPAHAIPLHDFAVVTRGARLVIREARAGKLVVEVPAIEALRAAAPLETSIGCDALSPSWVDFDARAVVGLPSADRAKQLWLRDATDVPLRATPDGEVRAVIARNPKQGVLAGGRVVERLEVQGAHARIAIDWGSVIVFGWVPNDPLMQPPGWGMGGLGLAGTKGAEPKAVWTCNEPLPLYVRIGDVVERVGTLAPGERLLMDRTTPQDASYGLEWLRPHERARFLLPPAHQRACRVAE